MTQQQANGQSLVIPLHILAKAGQIEFQWHRDGEVVDRFVLRCVIVCLEVLHKHAFRPELEHAFANIEKTVPQASCKRG